MAFGMGDMERDLATGAGYASGGVGAAQGGIAAAQQGLAQAQGVGREISGMLGNASNLAGQAARIVNGADKDIDALRGLAPQITGLTNNMNASADAIGALAGQIAAQGGNVAAYAPRVAGLGDQLLGRVGTTDALAGQVSGAASSLAPYSDALAALADHIFAHGHDMVGRANTVLDNGQGFINLDPSSSALAAEWLRQYAAVSPDAYAARAGADVQNASDIARAQNERALARRGVSLSSGAAATLQKQRATALAAAKAAAMTRGREAGRKEQVGILGSMSSLANQLLQTGTTMQKTGVDEELGSANARKAAADVTEAMGRLFANAGTIFGIGNDAVKDAGGLYNAAGGLEATAADMLGKAANAESASVAARDAAVKGIATQAGITGDAAKLSLAQANTLNDTAKTYQGNAQIKNSYLSNLNDANRTIVGGYNALSDAMNRAANYYLGGASIAQREYGGGGGGGGVNIVSTPAPADDWFNWRGTGHSETWNANHNPNYEAMIG